MDIDRLISSLKQAILPSKKEILQLLALAVEIFINEPNVLRLNGPITACGDTHGQLYDVLHLFEITGEPGSTRYVFLGDYVDRGYYSSELICLLLCYKVKYPKDFFMLRGNHETRSVNREYGFLAEIRAKYASEELWKKFNELFDFLPIGAIIDSRLFCVHGGLDPSADDLGRIDDIVRTEEPELDSEFAGILWGDPDESVEDWTRSKRRAGYLFNERHTKEFLRLNQLEKVIRSHEMADGYKMMFDNSLVTIWSAPNYCYMCGNRAGVIRASPGEIDTYVVYDPMPEGRRKRPPVSLLNNYYQ